MSTPPNPLAAVFPKAFGWSIALSILLILAGLLAILIPPISGIAATLFFGWAMIVSGLTHFLFAFKTHTTGGLLWELLLGAVYLFTGVYLLAHPLAALLTLTLFLAVYLFFEGVIEIIQSFQIRPRHGANWLLVDGVITLILGIMIWISWPSSSAWVVGTLVGISMIFSGLSRLMLTLAARRLISQLA
jgi:uncharacterized membrane protein HdeD (DUF308 family)